MVKRLGSIIFTCCFLLFAALLSIGNFMLQSSSIERSITDKDKAGYLENAASELLGKKYSSQFSFNEDLISVFEQANSMISYDKGISAIEIDALIEASIIEGEVVYDEQKIQNVFGKDPANGKYRALVDNTSWMFGREYSNSEDFKNDLLSKSDDVNRGIIAASGFSESDIKYYRFLLTKNSTTGFVASSSSLILFLTLILGCIGALMYIIPQFKEGEAGIKNNGVFFTNIMNRGWIGILLGTFLILFYILLYKYPEYITNWIYILDPLSTTLNGEPADQWFMYGFLYCLAMLVMGIRMLAKYRHSNYQKIRTLSVVFFQICIAFTLPQFLKRMNLPAYDMKSIWPLEYTFFFDYRLDEHLQAGTLGVWFLIWGIVLAIIGVPVITYFYGKRWYCSWVCGCGGLAETLGDPFRQLSDKSLTAWKIERYLIHAVLVFAVIMTAAVLYTFSTDQSTLLGVNSYAIRSNYGFMIGFIFAGVVGTGFYPLMGNRMWCRFGCPLAAYLGMVQKFRSRFRITTNGGQCISCGNCSTYCEMGIDVKWYAQRGQNIIRSSCVGCGVCSAVCPRGVLNLENGKLEGRYNEPISLDSDGWKFN